MRHGYNLCMVQKGLGKERNTIGHCQRASFEIYKHLFSLLILFKSRKFSCYQENKFQGCHNQNDFLTYQNCRFLCSQFLGFQHEDHGLACRRGFVFTCTFNAQQSLTCCLSASQLGQQICWCRCTICPLDTLIFLTND